MEDSKISIMVYVEWFIISSLTLCRRTLKRFFGGYLFGMLFLYDMEFLSIIFLFLLFKDYIIYFATFRVV